MALLLMLSLDKILSLPFKSRHDIWHQAKFYGPEPVKKGHFNQITQTRILLKRDLRALRCQYYLIHYRKLLGNYQIIRL